MKITHTDNDVGFVKLFPVFKNEVGLERVEFLLCEAFFQKERVSFRVHRARLIENRRRRDAFDILFQNVAFRHKPFKYKFRIRTAAGI